MHRLIVLCAAFVVHSAWSQTGPGPALLASTFALSEGNGSLPPPYHHERRIVLRPDGTGEVLSWTGYGGPAGMVPSRIRLDPSCRPRLVEAILAADLGAPRTPSPAMPGGGSAVFEASGPGVSLKVDLHSGGSGTRPVAPVLDAFERCVATATALP